MAAKVQILFYGSCEQHVGDLNFVDAFSSASTAKQVALDLLEKKLKEDYHENYRIIETPTRVSIVDGNDREYEWYRIDACTLPLSLFS